MQRDCPVSWSDRYGGFWTITSYADVCAAEHDWDTFSVGPSMILPSFGTDRPLIPLDIDPPALTRFRQILLPFFTPQRMDTLLPRTREIAGQLLDDLAYGEVVDASPYARLLPAMVFGEYCGFPMADAAQFDQWVDDIVFARTDDESVARSAADEVYDYFRSLIALRRHDPGSDVISALLEADHAGGPLDDDEMLDICYLLFVAGLETTAGAIRVALWHLAQHPDELALLAADPSLIPAATEEFLRALSPVQAMARTLRLDTRIGDVQMRAGERVVLAFGAANRDPDVFECPYDVRIDRSPNPHVAFGIGAHRCLGSNLARREVNVALEEFIRRFPRFELAEPAPWHGVGRLAIRTLP
ncbi:MAG TPA: cytochrome P450 [Acidimicrobiia bacterium]|nr:cytochrome P450 [Acidimicrobiia bacterium]